MDKDIKTGDTDRENHPNISEKDSFWTTKTKRNNNRQQLKKRKKEKVSKSVNMVPNVHRNHEAY